MRTKITKENRYEFVDDYVIGYTYKNNKFYFEKEDYEIVSQHYWVCKSGVLNYNPIIVHSNRSCMIMTWQ